jgi:hypothetical protein
MIIKDAARGHCLRVIDGAMQAEGLEKFIGQLNKLGGTLFQDVDSGTIFSIREIVRGKPYESEGEVCKTCGGDMECYCRACFNSRWGEE